MSDHSHDSGSSSLLLGVLIGAVLTYLYATKSGQKIKKELLTDAARILENFGDELEKKEPMVKEKIEEKKEEVEKNVKEISEDIKDEIREVPEQVKKIQNKGRRFFFSRKPRNES